jgi:glycosyltransferase involved in cell wall biosynthesis
MHVMLSLAATDRGRSGLSTYVRGLWRAALRHDLVERLTLVGTRADLAAAGLPADPRVAAVRLPDPLDPRTPSVAFHLLGLPRLAARCGADVIHLPVGNRRPGRGGRVPVVATVHDIGGEQDGARAYGLARRIFSGVVVPRGLAAAARLIVISEATRAALARVDGALAERAVLVPNGVDLDRFHPGDPAAARREGARPLGIEGPYVLYTARLEHPSKNHVTLIRAFQAARRRLGVPHRLVLVGAEWHGAEVILEAVRASAGAVIHAGFVAEELVAPLIRGADLVVFPSLFEGFGLPAIEALACGVPLVASAASPIREVVGDAALVVDCREERALASAIESALSDDALRRQLRAAGPRRAAAFGWEACARRTVEVLGDAAARRAASPRVDPRSGTEEA